MPPRYAYWTILIDDKPTAFRARDQEELLPTLRQLRRTNKDVVLKWFARGRLWETPEAAQAASRAAAPAREKRGHDWRPGGAHKDPRDRFKKGGKRQDKGREGRERSRSAAPFGSQPDHARPRGAPPPGSQPWRDKPRGAPLGSQPWRDKPRGAPPGAPPWRDNPRKPESRGSSPWRDKPRGAPPAGSQPWRDKPRGALPGAQPWRDKPGAQASRGGRPWRDRPTTTAAGAARSRPPAPRSDRSESLQETDPKTRRESTSQPPSSEPPAAKPDSRNRR